jgi:hypothetical protein
MRTLWCFLFLIVLHVPCPGQHFKAEASLPVVQKDAFYRILLSPDVLVHVNDQLTDIRIYDGDGKEVPYLLESEIPVTQSQEFIEYEIISKEIKPGCCTSLLLRNQKKTPIDNIHLVIKNAEAARGASLLGSDDRENWFTLIDNFRIYAPTDAPETHEIKIVDFPWSNYEFYLLKTKDSTYAPLNILSAGYFKEKTSNGKYQELRAKVTATDSVSEKKTYVRIALDALHFMDKLEVAVSGTRYYRRSATLFEKRVHVKGKSREEYYQPLRNFELTSGRTAVIELPGVRGQQFIIEVENYDNPPLTISSVKAYQLNRYLTAWLPSSDDYKMLFGNANLNAPVYDITFFKDSIPEVTSILHAKSLTLLAGKEQATSTTFFTSKAFIWVAIIGIAVVLGFMSFKLIREQSGGPQG